MKEMAGSAASPQEEHRHGIVIEEDALKHQRLTDLRSLKGDRMIAGFDDATVALLVTQARLPVVTDLTVRAENRGCSRPTRPRRSSLVVSLHPIA
jgi:hypothetical protein